MATITLHGMTLFKNDLFNDLVLPDYFDKQIFINRLLREYGELPVMYPDYNFMKYMITSWGKEHAWQFNKIAQTMELTYEPLINYEVETTETVKGKNTGSYSSDVNATETNNDTTTTDENTTNKVSAFNSDTFSNASSSDVDGTVTSNGTTTNKTGTTGQSSDTNEYERTLLEKGDNSVRSAAYTVNEEFGLAKFDAYQVLIELFANDFLIPVY